MELGPADPETLSTGIDYAGCPSSHHPIDTSPHRPISPSCFIFFDMGTGHWVDVTRACLNLTDTYYMMSSARNLAVMISSAMRYTLRIWSSSPYPAILW